MFNKLILFLALTALVHAQTVFQGLGFPGFMNGLSPDGSQIAGVNNPSASFGNTTAYRWSFTNGLVSLGLFNGSSTAAYSSYTYANGLNATTVIGYGRTSDNSSNQAFSWNTSTGYDILATPSGFSSSQATAIAADGSSIFGQSFKSTGGLHYEATRWTSAGVTTLGTLPGNPSSFISDVSADGTVAVGRSGSAFVWQENSGMTAIGATDATAVSGNGLFVVGTTTGYPGTEAYRWSANSGLEQLGFLKDTDTGSFATDVSADGSIVVGYSYSNSEVLPFIWSSATGMRDLTSVISSNGGDVENWQLYTNGVLKISDDGHTIAGNGVGPNGYNEVWVSHVASIPDSTSTGSLIAACFCACVLLKRERRFRK